MNDIRTFGSAPHQMPWPGTPVGSADGPRRPYGLASLPALFATWRARKRYREDLEEKAKTNPHLIEDMGLKRWQVEAEIAKPFWQP